MNNHTSDVATRRDLDDTRETLFSFMQHADEASRQRDKALSKQLADFRAETNQKFASIDQRFNEIDQKFASIDQRFNEIDQKFEKMFTILDTIVKDIKIIKETQSLLIQKVQELDVRVTRLEKRV